jgi:hypothetical protein
MVTCFKEVWKIRVPPKIKILLWQLIRNRLPSCEQVAKVWGCRMCDLLFEGTWRTVTTSSSLVQWRGSCGWGHGMLSIVT